MKKLDDYLLDNDISVATFAKDVDVSRQTVYNWLEGFEPKLLHAHRVYEATDGHIIYEDWINENHGRSNSKNH